MDTEIFEVPNETYGGVHLTAYIAVIFWPCS